MKAVALHASFAPFHVTRLRCAQSLGEDLGHQLVSFQLADSQSDYAWPQVKDHEGGLQSMTLFPNRNRWSLSRREIRKGLRSHLNDVQPDVVALPGWGASESLAGLGWSLNNEKATVVFVDSHPFGNDNSRFKEWTRGLLVRRFNAALVAGKLHIRYLESLGFPAERCLVGYDVVDNDQFLIARQENEARQAPVLLSCLRLLPRKNALGVLEVLAHQAKEWVWIVAGDGPDLSALKEKVAALGLSGRVQLLGHVPYANLPAVYAGADVYLQPSLYEPWGLAVNEAMASGLPVLVSDRCGSRELVQEGVNGFTFDPAKPESLGSVLSQMLTLRDRWINFGAASQLIISKWGPDLFARNFWQACEMAIETRRSKKGPSPFDRVVGMAL